MDEPIPIPREWTADVAKILCEGDAHKIEWTLRAFQEWQAATLSAFRFEPQDAMASALSVPGVAGLKVNLPEDGQTYAFFFTHETRVFYGKICLRSDRLKIKIISAHAPRYGADKLS